MIRLLKVQGYTMDNPRLTTYTVKYDEKGKLLNPRTVATSKQYGWGEWQDSRKVPCTFGDCWWVSCPGHGGYILVTQNRALPYNPAPDDARRIFKDPSRVVDREDIFFQVFEFEEDCDWALLEYADPKLREYSLMLMNENRQNNGKPPKTAQQWIDEIISSLRRWNKSYLKPQDE